MPFCSWKVIWEQCQTHSKYTSASCVGQKMKFKFDYFIGGGSINLNNGLRFGHLTRQTATPFQRVRKPLISVACVVVRSNTRWAGLQKDEWSNKRRNTDLLNNVRKLVQTRTESTPLTEMQLIRLTILRINLSFIRSLENQVRVKTLVQIHFSR